MSSACFTYDTSFLDTTLKAFKWVMYSITLKVAYCKITLLPSKIMTSFTSPKIGMPCQMPTIITKPLQYLVPYTFAHVALPKIKEEIQVV